LDALLGDPRYATRLYAVKALGRFGDSGVLPSILAIAADMKEDPNLRRAASDASAKIKARTARGHA
jgi:HEAT repeat protein